MPGGQCLHRRPPPPQLAPPCSIGLHGWRLRAPPLVNPASATALCNEVTLLICLGLIFFLQLGPTSWAGAPSKACARGGGACPHGTPLSYTCIDVRTSDATSVTSPVMPLGPRSPYSRHRPLIQIHKSWDFVPLGYCPLGYCPPWVFVPVGFCPPGLLSHLDFVRLDIVLWVFVHWDFVLIPV